MYKLLNKIKKIVIAVSPILPLAVVFCNMAYAGVICALEIAIIAGLQYAQWWVKNDEKKSK